MATGCAPWAERRFDNILQAEKGTGADFSGPLLKGKNWENCAAIYGDENGGLMLMKMGIDDDFAGYLWLHMVAIDVDLCMVS